MPISRPRKRRATQAGTKVRTPEKWVHEQIEHLERLSTSRIEFHRQYQAFLAQKREEMIEDIKESLWNARLENIEFDCCRIVDSEFEDNPLSPAGSIIEPPGGRFNFGPISSYYQVFPALYVADQFATAYAEKFHGNIPAKTTQNTLTPAEINLRPNASFSYKRLSLHLEDVLDLRKFECLNSFAECIRKIQPTTELNQLAKKVGERTPLATISSLDLLRENIFFDNYQQWPAWLDQPANSQWLGLYAKLAGLQAIIYPSCRLQSGFNVAVFPENLIDSNSKIALVDPTPAVKMEFQTLNASNANEFIRAAFEAARPVKIGDIN